MSYILVYLTLKKHFISDYRRVLGRFIDVTLMPLGLFACGVYLSSIWAGLILSSLWVSFRAVMGMAARRPAPTVICAAVLSFLKITVALVFMSPELWAYQGAAYTAVVGVGVATASFLAPASISGILTDIFPFLPKILPGTYAVFSRSLALLWGVQQVSLAGANVVLLQNMTFEKFYYTKPFLGWFMAIPTVLVGVVLLKRSAVKSIGQIDSIEATHGSVSGNS